MAIQKPLPLPSEPSKQKGIFHLSLGALGIYLSYVILSIFSQKLYNTSYQSTTQLNPQTHQYQSHPFTHPSLIVWLSALFCSIFGLIKSSYTNTQPPNLISKKQSLTLGLLFAINMTCTNFALLYISYPTQVIARNSRYLFVVLIGTFLSRVPKNNNLKLPKHKLIVAMVITFGVVMFNVMKMSGNIIDKGDHHAYPQQWKGYILLFISMIADAMFCDSQAYAKATFHPTANHLFTTANSYAFIITLFYSIFTSTFIPSIQFILTHPQCLIHLIIVCLLQVTGQISIYYIVANFKQHIFPLISATRKIITIVCSIVIFNHTLNNWQWVAVGVVVAGMVVEVYDEVKEKGKDKKKIINNSNSLIKQQQNNNKKQIKTD